MARSRAAVSGGGNCGALRLVASGRLQWPGDGLAMQLAVGVTPMAADPASMAARSCLVVVGGSSAPLPPGGSCLVLGEAADVWSAGLWLVEASSSADEVD
jgi:hypothetical protein